MTELDLIEVTQILYVLYRYNLSLLSPTSLFTPLHYMSKSYDGSSPSRRRVTVVTDLYRVANILFKKFLQHFFDKKF